MGKMYAQCAKQVCGYMEMCKERAGRERHAPACALPKKMSPLALFVDNSLCGVVSRNTGSF